MSHITDKLKQTLSNLRQLVKDTDAKMNSLMGESYYAVVRRGEHFDLFYTRDDEKVAWFLAKSPLETILKPTVDQAEDLASHLQMLFGGDITEYEVIDYYKVLSQYKLDLEDTIEGIFEQHPEISE